MVEQVVLLDEEGRGIGITDKSTVHHRQTPLHLAFSCYVFRSGDGRLLLTQRASSKRTWPSVWTNSCCGHPAPDEPMVSAITRRLGDELGLPVRSLDLVLPRFRYRAVMDNGIVENEICPVFRAVTDETPHPDPAEVDAFEWVDWGPFARAVSLGEREISPWCRLQVDELLAVGPDPLAWPVADPADLPPAAHAVAGAGER